MPNNPENYPSKKNKSKAKGKPRDPRASSLETLKNWQENEGARK